MENKHKSLNVLTGFAIGSAIGATISLLMAPASGEETRRRIKTEIADAQMKAMNAIEDVQSKALSLVEDVREDVQQRASRLKSIGRHVLEEEKATLEQGTEDASQVFKS